jgi:hypothetical protein
MRNENEIKPNYARYKLFKEKPRPPFIVQMQHHWQRAGMIPRAPRAIFMNDTAEGQENITILKI